MPLRPLRPCPCPSYLPPTYPLPLRLAAECIFPFPCPAAPSVPALPRPASAPPPRLCSRNGGARRHQRRSVLWPRAVCAAHGNFLCLGCNWCVVIIYALRACRAPLWFLCSVLIPGVVGSWSYVGDSEKWTLPCEPATFCYGTLV
ncbi:hypothetical protein OH77DRAFT_323194 [Trametes cingulata]|nr:hypothetical protein OH77DRAFT_323194 [Trametes cingulata]